MGGVDRGVVIAVAAQIDPDSAFSPLSDYRMGAELSDSLCSLTLTYSLNLQYDLFFNSFIIQQDFFPTIYSYSRDLQLQPLNVVFIDRSNMFSDSIQGNSPCNFQKANIYSDKLATECKKYSRNASYLIFLSVTCVFYLLPNCFSCDIMALNPP